VVTRTLIAAGVAPDRLSAASYSEYAPAAGNDTDAGRTANRRIEIVLVPDLTDLPGYDELASAGGS
jgi:chemotaxis protein MotB